MGESSDDSSLIDRIKSWARAHAYRTNPDQQRPVLPVNESHPSAHQQLDGISSNPSRSTTIASASNVPPKHSASGLTSDASTAAVGDEAAESAPPATSPSSHTKAAGETSPAVTTIDKPRDKPPLSTRAKNGSIRFLGHTKDALCHSWVNVLLVFVPVGIVAEALSLSPGLVFATNAIAIVPLAGLLTHATESVASRLGDTWGALLNVSFGNAVELIIFIALVKNEIRIVQASLLGSILANLLLILGMAFLLGGLRFQEQIYNSTVTQMSAVMLSLAVMSLLLPTAFHASFSDAGLANSSTLKISRGTSVVLLIVYILYLLFQLKSHAYLYESTPQHIVDEESHPGVFADAFNSSSSSSSSDSSSDSDSDGSSDSHTTAKRIKRAFHRRRRKSNASSKDTNSAPSVTGSPTAEPHVALPAPGESNTGGTSQWHHNRRGSILNAILSGDEADDDRAPRIHDFEKAAGESSRSPEGKRKKKHKRRHLRSHRNKSVDGERSRENLSEKAPGNSTPQNAVHADNQESQPRVGFVDEIVVAGESTLANKKGFGIATRTGRPAFRPALPKVLSNTVFSAQPQLNTPGPSSSATRGLQPGLRRTNSLPDRLNRPTPLSTVSSRQPLPPYVQQRVLPDAPEDASEPPEHNMSRTAAVVMLLISTGLVALCAEFLVDAIPAMTDHSAVSQAFIGLIILPIVGNAAEHVTAVTVAAKNKMDLAIGVAVGSSIQIALFVTPIVVLLGWCLNRDMSLYFNLFETVSLFVTAFVVNFLVLDGRSNYLEGALLISAYVIIAVAAFFYPDTDSQSPLGGSQTDDNPARMLIRALMRM